MSDLAQSGAGENVPVAHGGHRDHHPVDAGRNGGEARVLVLLYEVAEAGEGEAGNENEHEHQAELPQ